MSSSRRSCEDENSTNISHILDYVIQMWEEPGQALASRSRPRSFCASLSPSTRHEELHPPDSRSGTDARLSFILTSQINRSKTLRGTLFWGYTFLKGLRDGLVIFLFVLKLDNCALISSLHVGLISDLAHLEVVALSIMSDHRCAFLVLPEP